MTQSKLKKAESDVLRLAMARYAEWSAANPHGLKPTWAIGATPSRKLRALINACIRLDKLRKDKK